MNEPLGWLLPLLALAAALVTLLVALKGVWSVRRSVQQWQQQRDQEAEDRDRDRE